MWHRSKRRYQITKGKFLSAAELDAFETVVLRSLGRPRSHRDALLLLLALHTGGRASELLNLTAADFDHYHNTIYLTGLKGSDSREIPLPKFLSTELRIFIRELAPEERIFSISYNRLRQIWVEYRPSKKKFHCLRHTFAVRLFQKTKDVRLLQVALGHRQVSNTMVYLDYLYSVSELKRLIPIELNDRGGGK